MGNRNVTRRISRTDLDFEQALRAEGTVMLREGPDISSFGMDASPNQSFSSPISPRFTPRNAQPATPTVVPPTPTPAPAGSSASLTTNSTHTATIPAKPPAPSPSSSSFDLFYETEDSERQQTNRRSIYRSPGTSSSPDLATLLRKAKERGTVLPSHHRKEKRRDDPPPLPTAGPSGGPNGNTFSTLTGRPRSSTQHSGPPTSFSPAATPRNVKNKNMFDASPDWVLTSSPKEVRENGGSKLPKSSVRAKTTAFLGRMLGQNTVRERSKTDLGPSSGPGAPSYSSPLFDAFTPPVPPLPAEHQSARATPVGSPIADVFGSGAPRPPVKTAKPLPPIMGSPAIRDGEDADERSMVFVEKGLPSPAINNRAPDVTLINHGKRRSMSVSDVEVKRSLATAPSVPPKPEPVKKDAPAKWEDTTISGILDDFKGELSQLETTSANRLDLRVVDPSTPARRALWTKANHAPQDEMPEPKKSTSSGHSHASTPALTLNMSLQNGDSEAGSLTSPVPMRNPSLQTPTRSASGPTSFGSARMQNTRPAQTPNPLRSRSGPASALSPHSLRDASKLRVLHRSTASNSEPSLIPAGDARVREPHRVRSVRLVPSSNTIQSTTGSSRSGSQQDLTLNDLTLSRFSSGQTKVDDDSTDIETRGKELATRCWNEDEDFLLKEKIAEWLGGQVLINKVALKHYIDFFDFTGLRLDLAFRKLCTKLFLKGETQQVDRILDEFSRRYWDCNPGGLYGSANIVHAVSYSLLLLNTDLHIADHNNKMSRSQFVKNTMTAIQMQINPLSPAQASTTELAFDDASVRGPYPDIIEPTRSKRSDSITSWNSVSRDSVMTASHNRTPEATTSNNNGSTTSLQISGAPEQRRRSVVAVPNVTYGRAWEGDMEILLKEMYNAVKSQQILQPLSSSGARPSVSSLSPGGALMRNRSLRGGPPDRLATLKRGSIRGLQSIMNAQAGASPYSSNSSIDGRVSPSPSFATSTHEAIYPYGSLTPALGFARNLTQTIIREAQEDDDRSIRSAGSTSTTISITDEELALLGAPWAKEGMLCRKHYWESTGKRARDKAWLDVFVVIQKGELNMFTFGGHGGHHHSGPVGGGTVGGGNWLSNAVPAGTISLTHTLAHALHPPGYNAQRPYCMVLTLANNSTYFFQAGTEELVHEWVSTCNYWAARMSKEPLAGGVSNMEYGWNRLLDQHPHARSQSDNESNVPDYSDAMSVRSGRSTRSRFGRRDGMSTVRGGLSEKTYIHDWKAPLPPTIPSMHDEETQMEALRKHARSLKEDLTQHNEYRRPMAALFAEGSEASRKAQVNWANKSQYLLTEIVKYDSYIDSLEKAMAMRLKKRGEKALERALNGAPDEGVSPKNTKWRGPEEGTIEEEVEPSTPGVDRSLSAQQQQQLHRRETAEAGDESEDDD
ncbi:hypothetical protein BDN72DRAFT_956116 [Pluteus cervinus]|uniref:Uncharacterized protein n=1 Tax=Pluteus cervinus TaxID=181527 RepID=A0ACD3BAM1_9AGAR|nr:hypothetical protein BDN72DRAFT_956116 [Pluteus cervinus]